jgi:hypothetical protein
MGFVRRSPSARVTIAKRTGRPRPSRSVAGKRRDEVALEVDVGLVGPLQQHLVEGAALELEGRPVFAGDGLAGITAGVDSLAGRDQVRGGTPFSRRILSIAWSARSTS